MTEVIEEGCASWLFLLYFYSILTVDIYVIEMLESSKKDPLKGLLALKYQFTSLYQFNHLQLKYTVFATSFTSISQNLAFSVCYEKH